MGTWSRELSIFCKGKEYVRQNSVLEDGHMKQRVVYILQRICSSQQCAWGWAHEAESCLYSAKNLSLRTVCLRMGTWTESCLYSAKNLFVTTVCLRMGTWSRNLSIFGKEFVHHNSVLENGHMKQRVVYIRQRICSSQQCAWGWAHEVESCLYSAKNLFVRTVCLRMGTWNREFSIFCKEFVRQNSVLEDGHMKQRVVYILQRICSSEQCAWGWAHEYGSCL
jgi:hypothetical protein